ncbi:hypothetical protein [Shewanella algae]|uniref:hypothetical protein n=1 Tax=Shewanella algae TaxID=38313 RepID=UPI001AAF7378|nr:hypothetical protein [Shewanella algae]MBO2589346.1 hypothetical protein [Shewanella algae]
MNLKYIFIFAFFLVGCGNEKPPQKIEEIRSSIIAVNPPNELFDSRDLVIQVKSNSVFSTAIETGRIMKGIIDYFPLELDNKRNIWIISDVDVVDKYNNKSIESSFALSWKVDDVKKINFQNGFNEFALLNLTEVILPMTSVGHDLLVDYCKDEDNLTYTKRFCVTYAVSLAMSKKQ